MSRPIFRQYAQQTAICHGSALARRNELWLRSIEATRVRSIEPKNGSRRDGMKEFKVNPEFAISDEQSLRRLFPGHTSSRRHSQGPGLPRQACASLHQAFAVPLHRHAELDGRADVSPRGDPVGFVKILDQHTLAIPDRPGNNRLDSLVNILANPSVGLLFIIPGFDDTLRVNGQATLVTDPEILDSMSVNDRIPKLAIVVKVSEVFMHCAKAFRRSNCGTRIIFRIATRCRRCRRSSSIRRPVRRATTMRCAGSMTNSRMNTRRRFTDFGRIKALRRGTMLRLCLGPATASLLAGREYLD